MPATFILVTEYFYTSPHVVSRDDFDEAVAYAMDESQKAIKRCTIYRMDHPNGLVIELRSYEHGKLTTQHAEEKETTE